MPVARREHFVYHQSMNVDQLSGVAAAIGEPARARILSCLMDGHARTATELAIVAEVSPSTASVHLDRLKTAHLVAVMAQGKHRYYSLGGPNVARALEGLAVIGGHSRSEFVPTTPTRLQAARTCYDHMAGTLAVSLHDCFQERRWLSAKYEATPAGARAFESLGIDLAAIRALRRPFARACLDWSERRPHLGGALGAALLKIALRKRWVEQDLDSRALSVTSLGRRELSARFGITSSMSGQPWAGKGRARSSE